MGDFQGRQNPHKTNGDDRLIREGSTLAKAGDAAVALVQKLATATPAVLRARWGLLICDIVQGVQVAPLPAKRPRTCKETICMLFF